MSYDPTVWKSGDTITSAKLNKLEQGVADASGGGGGGGGVAVLTLNWAEDYSSCTLDKTYAEIFSYFANKTPVFAITDDGNGSWYGFCIIQEVGEIEAKLTVKVLPFYIGEVIEFVAATENSYPTWTA